MNSTVLMTTRSPTNPESSTETAALQILKIKMEKVLMEGFNKETNNNNTNNPWRFSDVCGGEEP